MYKVYAIAPNTTEVTVLEFPTRDSAINGCFYLCGRAYRIDKVTLPSGNEVKGEQIVRTMSSGIRATRVLLKYG
jgi:hypothetical protein